MATSNSMLKRKATFFPPSNPVSGFLNCCSRRRIETIATRMNRIGHAAKMAASDNTGLRLPADFGSWMLNLLDAFRAEIAAHHKSEN